MPGMRLLLSLLICINLALASWALWRPDTGAPVRAEPQGAPGLTLLSEVEQLPGPPGYAEQPDAAMPLAATPLCLQLGPFQTPADLRRAAGVLQPHVGRVQPREARATQLRGYRVYLPALPGRDEALSAARELAARGMRDYYVVTAGAEENTVSLGMFRELRNAEARREEVRALGFEPRLDPRTEDVSQWFLDIAIAEGQDWREMLGGYSGVEARSIACP
jgi:hypothetical protein